jgi:hypothetical protein
LINLASSLSNLEERDREHHRDQPRDWTSE